MRDGIILAIQKLNLILVKVKIPIINKIVKYQTKFIDANSLSNIKEYIFKLATDRKQIKKIIIKYERYITEIDKQQIIKKENNNLQNIRNKYNNLLIELNMVNDNIKDTLQNIILKIK